FDFPGFFGFLEKAGYHGTGIIEVYNNCYKSFEEIYKSYNDLKNQRKDCFLKTLGYNVKGTMIGLLPVKPTGS
ncbi:MAG: hypothetical protein IJT66_00710, partial [Clostridia bacterium]|nr:hypothetical protein [Clostridia bacterium]